MKSVSTTVRLLEDSLLIGLLAGMVALACLQILLRNFFDTGIIWIDPLLRVMVLWAGMIGATVASRDNRHIRIDLLSRFLGKRILLAIQVLIGLFTAAVCGIIAWYGADWVLMDYRDQLTAFNDVPSWLLQSVIPVAFGMIAVRYLLHSWRWMQLFIDFDPQRIDPT